MNGMKNEIRPLFLKDAVLNSEYFETPNPYKTAPSCNVNLLLLSRYAKKIGKKLIELTKEEIEMFSIKIDL